MRIIGGRFKGTALFSPKTKTVRPTADRVREALFNIIGPAMQDAAFLDLYGGAGAVGIEAVSRGAGRVVIVELEQIDLIRKNAAKCGVSTSEKFHVIRGEVEKAAVILQERGERFDYVFADPPWHEGFEAEALHATMQTLAEDGTFILEAFHKTTPPEDLSNTLRLAQTRRYGDTVLHFYR